MRDLYKRLNVRITASPDEIRSAIYVCSSVAVKKDAEAVLLHTGRRKAYDQLNSVLTELGYLRAELGLSHAENWQGEEATEYSQTNRKPSSRYEELVQKVEQRNNKRRTKGVVGGVKDVLFGFVKLAGVIAAVVGGFAILLHLSDSSTESVTTNTTKASAGSESRRDVKQVGKVQQEFNAPAQPLPESGATRNHGNAPLVAPFEINTSAGSNYVSANLPTPFHSPRSGP